MTDGRPLDNVLGTRDPGRDGQRAWRETAAIAVLTALVAGIVIPTWYRFSVATIRSEESHLLLSLAQETALQVDPALHERLRSLGQLDPADYKRLMKPLEAMRRANTRIRNLYTAVREGSDIRLALDNAATAEHDSTSPAESKGDVLSTPTYNPMIRRALGDGRLPGRAATSGEPRTSQWGSLMTVWAPITDRASRQIGVIGIDVAVDDYVARLSDARNTARRWILQAALRILLLCIVYHWFRRRSLAAARVAQNAVRTLTVERERLRSVLEGTRVGTWESDLRTRELRINDRLASIIGYRHDELTPMTLDAWWSYIHPDDTTAVRATVNACIGSADPVFETDFRMLHKDGHWVWVSSRGNVVERDEQNRPLRMVGIHVDISSRKAMEQELSAAARRDRLTGLANRTLFMEQMQLTLERVTSGRQPHFAVLFLDFDRFKMINDTMGHAAGDELLQQISGRLSGCLGATDTYRGEYSENLVARFGGDEFLILINDLPSCADAKPVADRLLHLLTPAFTVNGREVHATASIGIVTSDHGAHDVESVIRNADVAMYEAKRSGKSRAVVYDEAMRTRLTRHVAIDNGLRAALGTRDFTLVYQPIVELDTGRTVSVEALARWTHPELGPISPTEFIPIAEESGLIISIGSWVLNESCRQLSQWRRECPETAPASVSVNISRAEIALGPALLERVRATLSTTGLPAQCLQLEVTEREVMRDPEASLAVMQQLRQIGVRLAMDDFGSGTSSLGCLRQYPFDVIKIDRAFVRDLAKSANVLAVIHATITLIENLGVASVAEGVENANEVAVLLSLGCRYAQGYYFSKPVAPHQLMASNVPWREVAILSLD